MSYWKVFISLMSKDWRSHLGVPLFVGLIFETLIAWAALRNGPYSEFGAYLVSPQGLISHLGIGALIATFLVTAVVNAHKDAKPPWTNEVGARLEELLTGATSFFATCTIPLADWFQSDTQGYFSHLLKHSVTGNHFPHHRVLIFKDDRQLREANEQYLGAHYSKSLAEIHRNYKIPLGFLRRDEVLGILKDFSLRGRAARWSNLYDETGHSTRSLNQIISTLDFGLIGYGGDRYQVYTFEKTRDSIRLEVIDDARPYLKLRNEIRKRVFNSNGLPNASHNFAAYCGVEDLDLAQPFVD